MADSSKTLRVPLGPFELYGVLGRGGMGEVWRGVHLESGVPVAVKVMTSELARSEDFRRKFIREVHAVAALDHPGIVTVFDLGEVDEGAEAASGGALVAQSPYLVMELAARGSLKELPRLERYTALRDILRRLLEALAHAHARGVVHRDIKLENVLLGEAVGDGQELRLSDFGLAFEPDDLNNADENVGQIAGSVHYMAPEQIQGRWRDQGPWTDLYAVGCMAFRLAAGFHAFDADRRGGQLQILSHHMYDPPASMTPTVLPVPEGFEGWVQRLLEKPHRLRFACAADAMAALEALGEAAVVETRAPGLNLRAVAELRTGLGLGLADEGHSATVVHVESVDALPSETGVTAATVGAGARRALASGPAASAGTDAHARSEAQTAATAATVAGGLPSAVDAFSDTVQTNAFPTLPPRPVPAAPRVAAPSPRRVRPQLPASWRRTEATDSPMLNGAGLGLYGLRTVPMVDREDARDALWQAVHEAHTTGAARLVLVEGPTGVGKSRLVRWIAERAVEVGAATALEAFYDAHDAPGAGLEAMVMRLFRARGLRYEAVLERVRHHLEHLGVRDSFHWEAVAELVSPAAVEADRRSFRIRSIQERYTVLQLLLEDLCRDRPVILWLDDVQWGPEGIDFARHLLYVQDERPFPVVVLLTALQGASTATVSRQLAELASHPEARRLALGPLDRTDQDELVRALLGLDERLAEDVIARTEGNPLFAVQLIGDWVERKVLAVGQDGFHLAPGATAPLPENIQTLWRGRLADLLRGRPASAQVALELAAVLGGQVDEVEWQAACRRASVAAPAALVETMIASRLAVATEGGWSFVHGMLRESLEVMARGAGTLAGHHRVCAEALAFELGGQDAARRGVAERIGRHYGLAGLPDKAAPYLLRGARERAWKSELLDAEALLERWEEALATARVPPDDLGWCEGWLLRSAVLRNRGKPLDALAVMDRARPVAIPRGGLQLGAKILLERGRVLYMARQSEEARQTLVEAGEMFEACGDMAGFADAIYSLGELYLYHMEDIEGAARCFEAALEWHTRREDPYMVACVQIAMAEVRAMRGDLDGAATLFSESQQTLDAHGARYVMLRAMNGLAEVHRLRGELEEAEGRLRQILSLYDSMGSGATELIRFNLGLVLNAQQRWESALDLFDALAALFEARGDAWFLQSVQMARLPGLATLARWDGFDAALAAVAWAVHEEGRSMDADDVACIHQSAEVAEGAGEPVRATAAWELALRGWRALKRRDKVREARVALERLAAEPL